MIKKSVGFYCFQPYDRKRCCNFVGMFFKLQVIMKEDVEKSVRDVRRLTVISFVMMTSHCALLLMGKRFPFSEILTVCFGFYLIYVISHRVFKFCLLMKAMLFYNYICMLCIWIERYQGFGRLLNPARLFMLSIGVVLYFFLIRHYINKYKRESNRVSQRDCF